MMTTTREYQQELLDLLFQEQVYPWNPADLEVEDYLSTKEAEITFSESLDSEELPKNLYQFFGISF